MPKDQKTIEVEGVSTREAIRKALKILGTTRDKVKIKVLSEEDKGLFGMKGARQAKVRVSLREDKNKERPK